MSSEPKNPDSSERRISRRGRDFWSRLPRVTGPNGDGRNLLGAGDRREARRYARVLAGGACYRKHATPERVVMGVPLSELSTAENTPEHAHEPPSLPTSRSSPGPDLMSTLEDRLRGIQVASAPKSHSVIVTRREMERAWLAESLNNQRVVRPAGELSDARRVASGQAGFYKVAKMIGEGKLSQYEQDQYWNKIASYSKNKLLDYFARSLQTAQFNLTEHMCRSVAISIDRRRNKFDKSVQKEIDSFIKGLRGDHSIRSKMVAQAGFSDWVQVGWVWKPFIRPGPKLVAQCDGGCPELTRFATSTIVLIGAVACARNWTSRAWAFAQYLVGFPATNKLIESLLLSPKQGHERSVDGWFAQANNKEAMELIDRLETHGESIWTAIVGVMGSAFKMEVPEDTVRNALRARRLNNIATVLSSTDKIVEHMKTLCETVIEIGQAWSRGLSVMEWRLSTVSSLMPSFAIEVVEMYQNKGVERAGSDLTHARKAVRLFKTGSEYMKCVMGSGAKPGQYAAFQTIWKMVWEMYKAAEQFFTLHAKRSVPFVVHFVGPTGVGKSALSQHLVGDLARTLGISYRGAQDHYFRNITSNYWEGYSHQCAVFYDDFLQNSSTRSSECSELISLVNNAPYLLNMAAVESKGRYLFASSFVMLTSNIDIPEDLSVADPMAVRRRRDAVVTVAVKEEYCNEFGAVNEEMMKDRNVDFLPDIYEFKYLEPRTGREIGESSSYSELLQFLVERYHMKLRTRPGTVTLESVEDEEVFELDSDTRSMAESLASPPRLDGVQDAPFWSMEMESSEGMPSSRTSVGADDVPSEFFKLDEETRGGVAESWIRKVFGTTFGPDSVVAIAASRTRTEFGKALSFASHYYPNWKSFVARYVRLREALVQTVPEPDKAKFDTLKVMQVGIGVFIAMLGAYATVRVVQRFMRREPERTSPIEDFAEQFASGDSKTAKQRRGMTLKTFSVSGEAQATNDPRGLELVKERYANTVVLVRLIREDETKVGVHGLLIGGKLIAVPYHLVASTPEAMDIEVVTRTTTFKFSVEAISICVQWKNCDLAVIVMPNHFPSYPKMVQHFVEQRDLFNLPLGTLGLLTLCSYEDYAMPFFQIVQHARRAGEHTYLAKGDSVQEITIVDSIHYQAHTLGGDCGAPLVWFHPSVSRKIVGFHVAGGQGLCASNILTYELMSQVFATLHTTQIVEPEVLDGKPTLKDGMSNVAQMAYYGLMPVERQFRQPKSSEIIPSKIYGAFPVITKPAALAITNGVSPLELGVRKGVAANCVLPPYELEIAREQIVAHYQDVAGKCDWRVLSLDEGLNGVVGDKWIKPLKMKTSPGYPFIVEPRRSRGKLDYIFWADGRWVASDRLKFMVQERIDLARERKVPETIFVDVLKDERRELEKVEALKTRIFNTCPVDLNIAIRMYFGSLSSLVMENHLSHEIAVGINPHSESWNVLYRRLKSNGSRWLAGDYSNYDKTFPRQLMMMIANIANEFYNDGNNVIRETLMETLCNRFHLANRVVYYQTHGNPSGNPLTTIINSFGNMALMRLAWMRLAEQHNPDLKLAFDEHVALSVYGDDNVATVSSCATWFNMNAISKSLAPFGVVFTPPKVGNVGNPDFLPEEEVTYLKRYFHKYQGLILAPLPEDRIKDTMNWIRKGPDDPGATRVNGFMTQLEMFHWGKEKFQAYTKELMHHLGKAGIRPLIGTWECFYQKYMDGTLDLDSFIKVGQDPFISTPMSGEASSPSEAPVNPRSGENCRNQMIAQSRKWIPYKEWRKQKRSSGDGILPTPVKVEHLNLEEKRAQNALDLFDRWVAEKGKAKAAPKAPPTKKSAPKAAPPKAKSSTTTTPKPASTPVANTTVSVLPVKQLVQPNVNVVNTMSGEELIIRIDGPQTMLAIPLMPGHCFAPQLDGAARLHAWAQWTTNPVVMYKSLNSVANDGVWYYRVMHDATVDILVEGSNWSYMSRAFVAQKACLNFSITVPLGSMANRRFSPANSDRCPYVLLIYKGSVPPCGEFWLRYKTSMGGLAGELSPSVTYEVKDGVFIDPVSEKPLSGIPLAPDGKATTYKFDSKPLDRVGVREFVKLTDGIPTVVVRANDPTPLVEKESKVSEVTIQNPKNSYAQTAQRVLNLAEKGLDVASTVAPLTKTIARRLGRGSHWLARVLPGLSAITSGKAIEDSSEIVMSGPFKEYNGFITVSPAILQAHELAGIASSTPVFLDGDNTARLAFLPFLGTVLSGFASAIVPELILSSISKGANQKKVAHKGMDAISFVYDGATSVSSGSGSGGDDSVGGTIDPEEPESPLPDIPDFGNDPESPQDFLSWATVNRHFGGFVIDDNGVPIVKWLGATYGKRDMLISCPSPKYYSNNRMPWDQERKRNLACYVEVDRAIQGCYLLMHCINWGDDSAGSWIRTLKGATYMGTVARFSGLSDSRSVIRVDDYAEWNKNPVHLLIGQAKGKYFAKDEGRACLFWCSIGAVQDATIAENYLANFHTAGVKAMTNRCFNKDGETQLSEYGSFSDRTFNSRSATLPEWIDPDAPGFLVNQKALFDAWGTSDLSRASLPVTIEAGPVRGLILARYDNANGWWQHVPLCAMSYTALSSRWSCDLLMGEMSSSSFYIKEDANYSACNKILRITPPAALCSGASLCVEIATVAGCNGLGSGVTYQGLTMTGGVAMPTTYLSMPISITRFVYEANVLDIHIAGDTSRPTNTVDGWDDDLYATLVYTCYLVKKDGSGMSEYAKRWLQFNNDYAQVTTDEFSYANSVSGDQYTMNDMNSIKVYRMEPTTNGASWGIGTATYSPCYMTCYSKSTAPLVSQCPIYRVSETTFVRTRAANPVVDIERLKRAEGTIVSSQPATELEGQS